jgi:hypothetical protein
MKTILKKAVSLFGFGILASFTFSAKSHARQPAWEMCARRLTGESDRVRSECLKKISRTPHLEKILRAGISLPPDSAEQEDETSLALDVITALKLKAMIPDLERLSEKEESGSFYLALNSLLDARLEPEAEKLYFARVKSKNTSAPAKMVLIDTLARMRLAIPVSDLKDLVEDHSPEVRSAVLSYVRIMIQKSSAPLSARYQLFVKQNEKLLLNQDRSQQLQIQAQSLFNEMKITSVVELPSIITAIRLVANVPRKKNNLFHRCARAYENFYQNESLDWRIVFGYKDGRPARFVGDRYERAVFVQKITKLGFVRAPSDDDLFTKNIIGPGGKTKKINLRVVSSSVGPDDDQNRLNPMQKWQSEYAEHVFREGLSRSQLIFYDGHSRDGGGPDFSPPRCTKNGHVDYGWYIRHRPGLKATIASLKTRKKIEMLPPPFIGLFSCVSDHHFAKRIREVQKGTAMINTSSLIYYADAMRSLNQAMVNLLEMKCEKDFKISDTRLSDFF